MQITTIIAASIPAVITGVATIVAAWIGRRKGDRNEVTEK